MAEIKEFTTAAKAAVAQEEDDRRIEFTIDGQPVTAWPPSPGQFAMAYTLTNERHSDGEKVAGLIDFFFGLLDKDAKLVLESRLLDRNDPFELDQVDEVLSWLMEQWSGRPTQSSNGSSPSPPSTGPVSTVPVRKQASTRSRSRSLASAT